MSSGDDRALVTGRRVLRDEAEAVRALGVRLGEEFVRAVDLFAACAGKIAVTGMGKSGLICKKIAATLSSTGSPAIFLHAADALHGDLGQLGAQDALLAVSKSGQTAEILHVLDAGRRLGLPVVAMTGDRRSPLAQHADVSLDVGVAEEACPLGLAPTASTTAAMAMGDALAMALMERKGFRVEDFVTVHPAGTLGRKLLRVSDLMHREEAVPRVLESTPMADVIYEMSRKGLGVTTVTNERGILTGIISDGDLRRLLQRSPRPLELCAGKCMTRSPKTIPPSELATAALARMEELKITSLAVVDPAGSVLGIIHIHDLWRTQMF
ncbi:MAG: KpsF/GutQ family sugar-phosphate isomerase [Acidobacteria bacterium]|nr:KpsF/GutQ family sugar-phosphate isomerase [Acidobacteriota bacterium]